jgi:hypothetical protein
MSWDLAVGLGMGFCIGVEWCLFLKRSAERGRWPYRRQP